MQTFRLIAVLAVFLGAIACGDDEPTTPTAPTQPTAVNQEFTGTLTVNGGRTHDFTTSSSGRITLTVTELVPDSTAEIGVSLGTWNGATCSVVIARDRATQSAQVEGNAGGAGNYCVRIYDAGELKAATDYKLTVSHF